jgi:outer membrane protein assembly factor BamE (lipoprotein component of BamABCDE complex)
LCWGMHLMKSSVPVPFFAALVLTALLSGCVRYENKRGVDVLWQPEVTAQLIKGQSTREDILTLLGPPSQLIALEDETVLYYLFERSKGDGMILIVYNRMKIRTRYDRAVFFFDENDTLRDYATYIHEDEDEPE